MNEFDLIQELLHHAATPASAHCLAGPGDDAAIFQIPAGQHLVSSLDTLNEGIHFPAGTDPADLGWRALAVNLSDLAAMGADPAWCLLSLSLPHADPDWVAGFAQGLGACARQYGVMLAGGDTTRGPLAISIQISGLVPAGQALRRSGAGCGDLVCVTGSPGLAAAGLQCLLQDHPGQRARARFLRPEPRVALGRALRGVATAAIDVSDGLLQDLNHLLSASRCGARLQLDQVPLDEDLLLAVGPEAARSLALAGGDDYELCFTVPEGRAAELGTLSVQYELPVTVIGRVIAEPGLYQDDGTGGLQALEPEGYQHFRGAEQ